MISHKRIHTGEDVRDFVYGFHDGMVTTLAIITALTAAALSSSIIILAGIANILADGSSMSLGGYISAKSQKEIYKKIDINPKKVGLITFISFLIGGVIPLFPYFLFNINTAFVVSVVISFIGFFTVGSLRTIFTKKNWFISGLEMLAIGFVAVAIAFIVGRFIAAL